MRARLGTCSGLWAQAVIYTAGASAPGTKQTVTISGLTSNTIYYFLIAPQGTCGNIADETVGCGATRKASGVSSDQGVCQ